jgi:uncharacterized lipoprotein YmbA
MKIRFSAFPLVFASLSGVLLSGCLLKTATVPARHFVLAPITADGSRPVAQDLPVEIGFVKMPAYLLRDSMAVRNGANEIEYVENALWAERLDHCFQRTLLADLCGSCRSSDHNWKTVRIFIDVDQFDVDTLGHGRLVAQWRIGALDGTGSLQIGHVSLSRTGVPPHGDPAAMARTMSELTAEFSHEVTSSICGTVTTSADVRSSR